MFCGRSLVYRLASVVRRKFLYHSSVEILRVDDDAARICAEIMVAHRKAGTPLPTNDI
jgi:predicted nucleic acid-binding protein